MTTILGPLGVTFIEERGINPETAAKLGLYTATLTDSGTIPAANGNVIAFPFLEHGRAVNEKYRTLDKKFWQRKGGRKTFWNADALDDPMLEMGVVPLIITEGEIDALTAIDNGFPLTVSVPDGAPPATEAEAEPIDNDATGKFAFMWNNRDRLKRIKRFVIATDNDAPGQRLADELVRRLGAARCSFVTYPEGCKDLNDALRRDRTNVAEILNGAKPYPVRGLYRLSEYPQIDTFDVISTGFRPLDGYGPQGEATAGRMKLFAGELMIVTGTPSHGKSTFVLNLLINVARSHGWRAAIFSPEMPTMPHMRGKLRRMLDYDDRRDNPAEHDAFIEDHFTFIDNDPNADEQDDITLEWLLERAADAVLRDGIRAFVIDPWNEIEHARRRDENTTEYIGRALRQIKRFGRLYGVAMIVVAHPTKPMDSKRKHVSLYDIEGSAHWFNKCDHGVIIERDGENESTIGIAKVRFEESGERGEVKMKYLKHFARYVELVPTPPPEVEGFT